MKNVLKKFWVLLIMFTFFGVIKVKADGVFCTTATNLKGQHANYGDEFNYYLGINDLVNVWYFEQIEYLLEFNPNDLEIVSYDGDKIVHMPNGWNDYGSHEYENNIIVKVSANDHKSYENVFAVDDIISPAFIKFRVKSTESKNTEIRLLSHVQNESLNLGGIPSNFWVFRVDEEMYDYVECDTDSITTIKINDNDDEIETTENENNDNKDLLIYLYITVGLLLIAIVVIIVLVVKNKKIKMQ